jgi:symplekin
MEMVGMMAGNTREQVLSLLNSAKNHPEMGIRIDSLKQLKDILLHRDPSMLKEFTTSLPELQTAPFSLVRKYLAEMIEEIGLKNLEHLSQMVPVLLAFLKDDTQLLSVSLLPVGQIYFVMLWNMLPYRLSIMVSWINGLRTYGR